MGLSLNSSFVCAVFVARNSFSPRFNTLHLIALLTPLSIAPKSFFILHHPNHPSPFFKPSTPQVRFATKSKTRGFVYPLSFNKPKGNA